MNDDTRVAIVTGASSGIGLACAIALDQAGMRLVLVGRQLSRLENVAAQFSQAPELVAGDVAEPETSQAAVDRALGTAPEILADAAIKLVFGVGALGHSVLRYSGFGHGRNGAHLYGWRELSQTHTTCGLECLLKLLYFRCLEQKTCALWHWCSLNVYGDF